MHPFPHREIRSVTNDRYTGTYPESVHTSLTRRVWKSHLHHQKSFKKKKKGSKIIFSSEKFHQTPLVRNTLAKQRENQSLSQILNWFASLEGIRKDVSKPCLWVCKLNQSVKKICAKHSKIQLGRQTIRQIKRKKSALSYAALDLVWNCLNTFTSWNWWCAQSSFV